MADKYPKLTQEALEDSINVIMSNITDPDYLKGSTYSALMKNKISTLSEKVKVDFDKLNVEKIPEAKKLTKEEEEKQLKEIEDAENESIDIQFGTFKNDLKNKNAQYKEQFGILIRMEKTIRSMERLVSNGSSDTVKISAMTKLMDLQDDQAEILNKLANVEKSQKIETLTRNFFQEVKGTKHLEKLGDTYLKLLNDLD